MKHTIVIKLLFLYLLTAFLTACDKDENEEDLLSALKVYPTSLELTGKKSAHIIEISSTNNWKIECNVNWCSFSQQEGTKETRVKIEFTENTEGRPREAIITITNQKQEKIELTVYQPLNNLLGTGARANPYQIRTAYELDLLRQYTQINYKDHYFQLMNDIDLTDFLKDQEKGWEPIGSFFHGNILGDGHKITGIWFNRPDEKYAGLFNIVTGSIYQLGVETGEKGMIADYYSGIIARSVSFLSECYTTGRITVSGNYGSGLIVEGEVENCYSTAEIRNGGSKTAGICPGQNLGRVRNSYFAGSFTNPMDAKPITNSSYNNIDCYFDSETTNIADGQTTEEMKMQVTFFGWDFENIWQIEEGVNYPTLRCFNK